jgi:RNA ligase (TIGR02306 family)
LWRKAGRDLVVEVQMDNDERRLASIKKITALKAIEGADRIECATIDGGWEVVVKKGEFKVGEQCLYIEIDAWVPHELAPFLSKGKEPREFRRVRGERLRTIKLKGQLSQGLVFTVEVCVKMAAYYDDYVDYYDSLEALLDDLDFHGISLDEKFGIQKWEMPTSSRLRGQVKGAFPSTIPKTDQERVQNLDGEIDWDDEYQISIKLDGTSMTMWLDENGWHVCSRNLELRLEQEGNYLVDECNRRIGFLRGGLGDDASLKPLMGLAFQGELVGEGIQGNRENLHGHTFYVFDVWNINDQFYLNTIDVKQLFYRWDFIHVPILKINTKLSRIGVNSIETALKFADGGSLLNDVREGVVFKRTHGDRFTFKAISNEFLMKTK